MTPPEHSDALAEHQAEASRFAKTLEGMLLQKFELAVRREIMVNSNELHARRAASIKAANNTYHSTKAALIEAIKALQAKAARE